MVPNVETALIGGPIEFGTQYYYIITMPIAGVLDVFVDSSNGGDPDIFLFDSSSNLVLESASLGSEAITNLPVLADDYVLRVDAYGAPLEDHFVSLLLTST
ncbi:MAG: hypothetical protein A2289_08935 [Deltaproteobacteria bacterium RIFOXYA12_FULL_58_15]|nr:MAG: hypothetical protein A2289_08935 [Deltaproteobacteria bacterium RIFOXYA12_FULL_58_15]